MLKLQMIFILICCFTFVKQSSIKMSKPLKTVSQPKQPTISITYKCSGREFKFTDITKESFHNAKCEFLVISFNETIKKKFTEVTYTAFFFFFIIRLVRFIYEFIFQIT